MVSGQFSLGLPFPFFLLEPIVHLFGSSILVHSGHMTQPRKSLSSDDAPQFSLKHTQMPWGQHSHTQYEDHIQVPYNTYGHRPNRNLARL